jgi:hypothetical protein
MRPSRLAFAVIALACCAVGANASSLDPSRIAAIDRAAGDFLARAADARKSGEAPRQSEPDIAPLLDTVFDTSELSHGPVPLADLGKLDDWLSRIVSVGRVYLSAARGVHDFGLFGAEIGRFVDASVAVEQAMADSVMAELDAHPGGQPAPDDARKLARLRASMGASLDETISLFRAPGLTAGWVREHLTAMTAAAPSMARFLAPDELARLRATILRLAATVRDKALRGAFAGLAEAFAEPRAPSTAPAETVARSPSNSSSIAAPASSRCRATWSSP